MASDDEQGSLYAEREKIQARHITGFFQTLRVITIWLTLGIYCLGPWLTWHDRQAILFDLPRRQFHIFEITFWPQDFILLVLLAIIAATSLFFFTTLAGRLWCGYTCPQTVWTKLFMWVERKLEGNRLARLKLDKSKLTFNKAWRRGGKHTLWLVIAFTTAFIFVGYFTPIKVLFDEIRTLALGPWEIFWLSFFTLATYMNAGWMREQVCLYLCPYARFQSTMFDDNTMVITYDEKRGEPRGSRAKSADPRNLGLGSCVDCTLCVQVCPTGIDIRDGLQMACIGCAACVDACDQIMDKMQYPRGLIRYSSEKAVTGGQPKILRPRLVTCGLLLILFSALFIGLMTTRLPFRLDILHDRKHLYRETVDGAIENSYLLKIINMSQEPRSFSISVSGIPYQRITGHTTERVEGNTIETVPLAIHVLPKDIKTQTSTITFTLSPLDAPEQRLSVKNRFIGPTS